jgi:hypothetical protein
MVSMMKKLRKLLLLGAFWFALIGAPISPQEIEELLCRFNVPKVAYALRQQRDSGDPPEPAL